MARRRGQGKRPIESYDHRGEERLNNPPVGLVTPDTDRDAGGKTYEYDPHLDPQLQWAGKAEHTSFEVPTVSLHVHERIDPRTIIEATRKRNGNGGPTQGSLFELPEENPPVRDAIEFYRHRHNWTNRLVSGDSLLVMNSLLEKESMAGKVQMVYVDPPYGIRYGSNFQPFVDKRDVRDGRDEDLTAEPETIKAFRDTWELGIHSYLSYLRDRLLLARELLTESGSVFVQIGDENVHSVGLLLDEIYGAQNRVATVSFATTSGSSTGYLPQVSDYLLWYAKDIKQAKYRQLYEPLTRAEVIEFFSSYVGIELPDGDCRKPTDEERFDPDEYLPEDARIYRRVGLDSQGISVTGRSEPYDWNGRVFYCGANRHWSISKDGMDKLAELGRLEALEGQDSLMWKKYEDEVPGRRINNVWPAQMYPSDKRYVVETSTKAIQRCMLMTTDPGDLVFDPTCGSGTTAYVAEQWGRRWITCDTSRVAITLAQQRLMTALYDYYELAHPEEGVGSGLNYKTVPYVSPSVLSGDAPGKAITVYDQPLVDRTKRRVTGPFSVEAVPAPGVNSLEWLVDSEEGESPSQLSTSHYPQSTTVSRSGETLRQADWRDELLKTGIRGKSGQYIRFARLEPLPGAPGLRHLHADGESLPNDDGPGRLREGAGSATQRIVVSFGPEHAPLEQRQVAAAIEEAQTLVPRPRVIVFAAFQFDPEAAKDIDETHWPGVALLKAQMNADLLTDDLKKNRASNESFWLIGQPDVVVNSEEWIVNSRGEALAPYGVVAKLSGVDSLAEIDGLGRDRLSAVIAIAERRDLWDALSVDAGGGVDPGQHSGGTGASRHGGVPSLPGSRAGLPGRVGDSADLVRQLGTVDRGRLDSRIESLRRDRQIVDRAREIAPSLTSPLSTTHYSQVTIHGFDYYNTKSGEVESGGEDRIATWMLDTDYDGRSLYPRQVFFPMAGAGDGWVRLARNLKAEIDEDLIEAYRGTVSLPFKAGEHGRVAVKIVDDRGIESLRVIGLDAAPSQSNPPSQPIEDRIDELFADVPQEEWDRLPDDLIDNLDHYTAGADKKTERPKRSIEEILKDQARQVPPEEWSKLPSDLIERLDHYTSGADV